MKKLIFFLLILNFVLTPGVLSEPKRGHIKLLAVKENPDGGYTGGLADLFLETNEGSGRVFLETFPLTKTDTQMSTRFAKTIACDYVNVDCSRYDFFYTITADSPIIAGPSAGSSISALTIALLMGVDLDNKVVATGTINSGGLVGPVGGLKAKITAASEAGHKKVLIPLGENIGREENETINITDFSKELGIEIIEVSTIGDVVEHFTGIKKKKSSVSIDISKEYSSKMRELSLQLCERSAQLKEKIENSNFSFSEGKNSSMFNISAINKEALNLTSKGKEAFAKGEYYSSASYCFGANVQLTNAILQSKNLSQEEIRENVKKLKESIEGFGNEIDGKKKRTITDLETYMVVKERLAEANEVADDAVGTLNLTNSTALSTRVLAYGLERFNSAKSWATFFGSDGKEFNLNKEVIKKSCRDKLSEVEERIQYAELYFPDSLENIKKEKDNAYEELSNENYELCLFKASKAKAGVDVVLGVFGVDSEQFIELLERKLDIVKESLSSQTVKGIFPIIGYSYYEYANSLKETNTLSGLLYSEYALELGNLDIYFETGKPKKDAYANFDSKGKIDKNLVIVLIAGILIGIFIGIGIMKGKHGKHPVEVKVK